VLCSRYPARPQRPNRSGTIQKRVGPRRLHNRSTRRRQSPELPPVPRYDRHILRHPLAFSWIGGQPHSGRLCPLVLRNRRSDKTAEPVNNERESRLLRTARTVRYKDKPTRNQLDSGSRTTGSSTTNAITLNYHRTRDTCVDDRMAVDPPRGRMHQLPRVGE
jgi:hypothetical protein